MTTKKYSLIWEKLEADGSKLNKNNINQNKIL